MKTGFIVHRCLHIQKKKCLIVLDNDRNKPEDIRRDILNIEKDFRQKIRISTALLTDDNLFFFPEYVYSIEFYLLNAEAICKAFESSDNKTLNDIDKIIQSKLTAIRSKSVRPKELLSEICFKYFHRYNEVETPAKIAENLSKDYLEKFPEIKILIQRIIHYGLG